jgi:hypothetical protein
MDGFPGCLSQSIERERASERERGDDEGSAVSEHPDRDLFTGVLARMCARTRVVCECRVSEPFTA